MFHVKICGITRAEDARHAADCGADAVGFNFYAGSRRHVSVKNAVALASQLPTHVARVGVFVNASVEEIQHCASEAALDWIQLHGDEPPETIAQLAPRRVLRAVRWRCESESVEQLSQTWGSCGAAALLVDAYHSSEYGGTGRVVDWEQSRQLSSVLSIPWVLAGGLSPANIGEAVKTARPSAVDTASGVEAAPGVKDPDLMREFVHNALKAWEQES